MDAHVHRRLDTYLCVRARACPCAGLFTHTYGCVSVHMRVHTRVGVCMCTRWGGTGGFGGSGRGFGEIWGLWEGFGHSEGLGGGEFGGSGGGLG